MQNDKSKIKYSSASQFRMTNVGLIKFEARFLDFAPVLSDESTGASLEMTEGEVASIEMTP